MEELVVKKETMSSREVAELTGKQHAHVMRDIRNMVDNLKKYNESTSGFVDYSSDYNRGDRTQYKYISEKSQKTILDFCFKTGNKDVSEYVIKESSYKDAKGEMRSVYVLNKKASMLLASGYDAFLRAKIIDRWEELEKEKLKGFVIPGSFSQALMLAAKQQEQIEEQQKQISVMNTEIVEMKKKTDYLEIILNSKETVTITQIAQDYGMTAKSFNRLLEELKIQRKVNGQWILYSPYITQGYVHSKSVPIMHKDGSRDSVLNTEWRQKGRIFLYEKLKKAGVLPLIERN